MMLTDMSTQKNRLVILNPGCSWGDLKNANAWAPSLDSLILLVWDRVQALIRFQSSLSTSNIRTSGLESWKQVGEGRFRTTYWALKGPRQQSCQEVLESGWNQSKVRAWGWGESRANHRLWWTRPIGRHWFIPVTEKRQRKHSGCAEGNGPGKWRPGWTSDVQPRGQCWGTSNRKPEGRHGPITKAKVKYRLCLPRAQSNKERRLAWEWRVDRGYLERNIILTLEPAGQQAELIKGS